MIWGLDHLGLAKYGELARGEHPEGWALGAFSRVSGFGDALPAVRAILADGRCPRVRLHLAWDDDHKITDFRSIEREAKRVADLYRPFVGRVDCRVSGGCEHTWDTRTAEAVRSSVMSVMPSGVTYVNTPLLKGARRGAILRGVVNELHGTGARPISGRFDFSYDGSNCVDSDVTTDKRVLSQAETFYFWNCQFNGRRKLTDATPRAQRRAYPNSRQIDSIIYLSTDRGRVSLPEHFLAKSHSDQHYDKPVGREQKPVLLLPVNVREVVVVAANGQVLARARNAGKFDERNSPVQRWRYYVPEWGYLLSEKALRITGSPICSLVIDGRKRGSFNPAFRQGSYR